MSKKFEINIKDDEEKRKLNSGTLSNQIIQICKRCHGLIPVINLNYDPSCSLWFWIAIQGDFINFYNIYKTKHIWDIYLVDG